MTSWRSWLTRQPAKLMPIGRAGSNPVGVVNGNVPER